MQICQPWYGSKTKQSSGHFRSFFLPPDPNFEKNHLNQLIKKFWPNLDSKQSLWPSKLVEV